MDLWNARSADFAFGANLHDSEYAFQQSYSNFFFFITGFHGFHVFSGVIINIVVFFMVLNRVMERRKTTRWSRRWPVLALRRPRVGVRVHLLHFI